MYATPEVAFDELTGRNGSIGLVVLKRTSVLNALSLAMLNAMSQQLMEWESAAHIKAVIIRSADTRAFSAGGDIRYVYERRLSDDATLLDYFRIEYQLDYRIHNYRKPFIALLDGITMGGGAGLSIHGSHRVATHRLVLAMPETGIGFYPDVGMTYVLSRLPHCIGHYIGLTGTRLSRADCLALGLVTHAVNAEVFPELIYALSDASLDEDADETVSAIIDRFVEKDGVSPLWDHREEINTAFSKESIEDILHVLDRGSSWAQEVATIMRQKSPLSLKVTHEALRKAASMDFENCMEMEFALSVHFLEGDDFFEGIRAVVIDRDKSPKWKPATLKGVTTKMVANYFEPVGALLRESD